jgi:hypothetical protein
MNVKGGDDLGGYKAYENHEGGAKRDRMPDSGLDRISRI